MEMASTGHSSTQTPQSTHLSSITTALPSCISMASLGQQSTHAPHPVHVSAFTFAGIINSFQSLIDNSSLETGSEVYINSTTKTIFFFRNFEIFSSCNGCHGPKIRVRHHRPYPIERFRPPVRQPPHYVRSMSAQDRTTCPAPGPAGPSPASAPAISHD